MAVPRELSSKSGEVMVTAIWDTAVVAIITVGGEAAATTMVGAIITMGGDFYLRPFLRGRASVGGLMSFQLIAPYHRLALFRTGRDG